MAKPAIQVLDRQTYTRRLVAARKQRNPEPLMYAMYSSIVDGIVTDPDQMSVPIDDHAFCRGHAVFDTCSLSNGVVYRLDTHLTRLFKSARAARIPLPFEGDEQQNRERMAEAICATCVASGRRTANVRYWLSVGYGNLGFTPKGCTTTFYCLVFGPASPMPHPGAEVTVRSVPMKPPLLAELKSNNYMLNCLTGMAAQEAGGFFGILVKPDGNIAEGCIVNTMFVTRDCVLRTPSFEGILAGTTARRAMELAEQVLVRKTGLLKAVRQGDVPYEEAKACVEVMMVGADTQVYPVRLWDGQKVGDGEVGPVARELQRLLLEDQESGAEEHIRLSYPAPASRL